MKIHSLTILHYGKDYLPYALRSVYDQVDQCHIFYTPTPSHGHQTNIPPVETKDELRAAAFAYNPGGKIRWYDVENLRYEGQHRDLALQTIIGAGADIVLVVDYDEIWPAKVLADSLEQVINHGETRNNLINMIHFWRSFGYACYDQGWPVRIIDTRFVSGTNYLQTGKVFHFGYAVTDRVMAYKWLIHGHKNELRPGWLDNIWPKWPPADDCHPTNDKGFWRPVPFDKTVLPEFMKGHPFYNLEMIR